MIQLLTELHLANPEGVFRLSKGEQQQLKQLEHQINQAKGTLQVLQQSLIQLGFNHRFQCVGSKWFSIDGSK